MRIVIIAVIALILLGGAGYTAYSFFEHGEFVLPFGEKEEAESGRDDANDVGDPYYVQLDPIRLTVFRGNRVFRHVEILLALQAYDLESRDLFDENKDRISAEFLEELTRYISLQYRESGSLDPGHIKARLRIIGERLLGTVTVAKAGEQKEEERLQDVLIRNLVTRKPPQS